MEGLEKRLLLAIFLSALVFILYTYLIPVPPPPPRDRQTEPPAPRQEGAIPSREERIKISGEMEREEKAVTVETDLYKAVFSNRGGVITHWELKQYWVDVKKTKNIILFDPVGLTVSTYPMSVTVGDGEFNRLLQEGLFSIEGGDLRLSDKNPEGRLTFAFIDPKSGRGLKKSFIFYNGSYKIDVEITPVNLRVPYAVSTGSNFGISEWGEEKVFGFVGPMTQVGTKVRKEKVAKIKGSVSYEGEIKWTAVQDKYFIAAIIPESKASKAIVRKMGDKDIQSTIEFPEGQRATFILYAGPKEYERLKSFGVGLDSSISFGWFIVWDLSIIRWLALGLFTLLRFFYGISHNYGIAIILLTAVVRVVFTPLTYKSFKSMKDIQKLQPEIQKLQKKYKDDRAELNKALMELYKTHKVNPLGGCLPMLLQLPVFIGLYNLLASTIELRQTPFFLWIKDLSVKDPYYVLPIIMGITMLIQQKMTPSTMDPTQAKVMLIMPVIFTFFFLNFPSGLVLYWLVNNLLTIGQQYVIKRYFK